MKNIIKVTLISSFLLAFIGCDSNTANNYVEDSFYIKNITSNTLAFSDAFNTNYPTSKEDFEEDMKKAIKKVENAHKMETTEGKKAIEAYREFMEYECEFVKKNWDDYDNIESLIDNDKKGRELYNSLENSEKEFNKKLDK